jgi:Tropinone reductase 1
LESAFALSQLAHPLLKASGDGVIIFNSSVAGGPTAMQSGAVYGLTKAALNQMARNFTCEWAAKDKIRAVSVAPW